MKLGGQLELKDLEVKTSTKEARIIFLELIPELMPEVVFDLTRLFNLESLPKDWLDSPLDWLGDNAEIRFAKRFFLLHTKQPNLYSSDLSSWKIKPDVRNTPLLAYFDFLFKNQAELDKFLIESEKNWKGYTPNPQQELITERALEYLIPDWKTLQTKVGSEWLCAELKKWAMKWNLNDDWCMDFALHCLKNFKTGMIDKLRFPKDFLENDNVMYLWEFNNYVNNGKAWNDAIFFLQFSNTENHFFIPQQFPNFPLFRYVWLQQSEKQVEEVFTIEGKYNPLVDQDQNFREKMEWLFWRNFFEYFQFKWSVFVSNHTKVIGELKEFHGLLETYISNVKKEIKPYTVETVSKRSGDKHFRWLVEYQIAGKSYNKLTQKVGLDRKAITQGIKDTSQILGLILRDSTPGGRIEGAKDLTKQTRRRVSKKY